MLLLSEQIHQCALYANIATPLRECGMRFGVATAAALKKSHTAVSTGLLSCAGQINRVIV